MTHATQMTSATYHTSNTALLDSSTYDLQAEAQEAHCKGTIHCTVMLLAFSVQCAFGAACQPASAHLAEVCGVS
jgi:hypothetical protein